jgi:hypothetical protein
MGRRSTASRPGSAPSFESGSRSTSVSAAGHPPQPRGGVGEPPDGGCARRWRSAPNGLPWTFGRSRGRHRARRSTAERRRARVPAPARSASGDPRRRARLPPGSARRRCARRRALCGKALAEAGLVSSLRRRRRPAQRHALHGRDGSARVRSERSSTRRMPSPRPLEALAARRTFRRRARAARCPGAPAEIVRALVAGSERLDARARRPDGLLAPPSPRSTGPEALGFFAPGRRRLERGNGQPDRARRRRVGRQLHGQSLALAFDAPGSRADLASISERRSFRLLSPR